MIQVRMTNFIFLLHCIYRVDYIYFFQYGRGGISSHSHTFHGLFTLSTSPNPFTSPSSVISSSWMHFHAVLVSYSTFLSDFYVTFVFVGCRTTMKLKVECDTKIHYFRTGSRSKLPSVNGLRSWWAWMCRWCARCDVNSGYLHLKTLAHLLYQICSALSLWKFGFGGQPGLSTWRVW